MEFVQNLSVHVYWYMCIYNTGISNILQLELTVISYLSDSMYNPSEAGSLGLCGY